MTKLQWKPIGKNLSEIIPYKYTYYTTNSEDKVIRPDTAVITMPNTTIVKALMTENTIKLRG